MSRRSITTPAIEFREVSISFDDICALQKVSFVLPSGEMICITGDSCSGKIGAASNCSRAVAA